MALAMPKMGLARVARRPWARGQSLLFLVLAAVGATESLRLILGGGTTETRGSGWYLLVVTGLVVAGVFARPERSATPARGMHEETSREEPHGSRHTRDAVIFFAAASGFAWALPWVGFAVANGLFVAAYLVWVDHRRWWFAIVAAAVTDAVLVVGMHLLRVSLPAGVGFGV